MCCSKPKRIIDEVCSPAELQPDFMFKLLCGRVLCFICKSWGHETRSGCGQQVEAQKESQNASINPTVPGQHLGVCCLNYTELSVDCSNQCKTKWGPKIQFITTKSKQAEKLNDVFCLCSSISFTLFQHCGRNHTSLFTQIHFTEQTESSISHFASFCHVTDSQ